MRDDDITIWDCPQCSNGKLIKRKNKSGTIFLGCTNFPKCKYTQPMEKTEDSNIPDAASVWE
jgi:ssDNA-binding Zn-finger/Zn-ribbon topoisomerase 1